MLSRIIDKIRFAFVPILGSAFLFSAPDSSAETPNANPDLSGETQTTNTSTGLKVVGFFEKLPNGQIGHCHILGATNKFSFVVPSGFSAQGAPGGQKVWITKPGWPYAMSIEVTELLQPKPQPALGESPADAISKRVLAEYPGAEIVDRFESSVAHTSAMGFDVRWTNNGNPTGAQVVFATFPTAEVVFKLTGPIKDGGLDGKTSAGFSRLLRSFERKGIDEPWVARPYVTPE